MESINSIFSFTRPERSFVTELAYIEQKVSTALPDDTVNDTVNDERLSKMINAIQLDNRISALALAKELHESRITVIRDLNKLKEQGRIVRMGSDKTGHWEIL